jgi:uncharacterized protein with HEPN domain
MQRDSRAYLNDILEAAAAIQEATADVNAEAYCSNRLIRSAVEREFIIIGEALRVIGQQSPELFNRIPEALLANHCSHELNQLNQDAS